MYYKIKFYVDLWLWLWKWLALFRKSDVQVAGTRLLGTANTYRMRARLYGKFILHERSSSPTTVKTIIFSISSAIQQTPAFRTVTCFGQSEWTVSTVFTISVVYDTGLTDTDADSTIISSQEIMSNTKLRSETEELKH